MLSPDNDCFKAALKYQRDHNWALFPAPAGEKKSHKSARRSEGVKWGKTRSPDQLRKDWQEWPDADIGLPCGADNKVWAVEADTLEGHDVDGVGNLRKLIEQHGGIPETLMSLTPSGSTAWFFQWPEGVAIKNSVGRITPGVDVRGEGGMMIIPPSSHKLGGRRRWINEGVPIAPAPQWLVDAAVKAAPAHTFDASQDHELTADEPRLAAALAVIPNDVVDWSGWNNIGMAIWTSTKGSEGGRKLWHEWSKKWEGYDEAATNERWMKITSCPPNEIGAGTIFYFADQADPEWEVRFVNAAAEVNGESEPVDLWNVFAVPPLPTGVLPKVIEEFAREKSKLMGCDPAGLAAAALAVCSAAIPDRVQLKVKKHDGWSESTRLWIGLVGDPSVLKSPIINEAKRPLARLDGDKARANFKAKQEYDAKTREEKRQTTPPKQTRYIVEDTTTDAMMEVLRDSEDGVLCVRDELSGWFGAMDKYSGHKGAAADRGFWLQTWNGGSYSWHRIGRGSGYVPNLSASLLGGIQPEPMREVAKGSLDDGLIQRINPIMLGPSTLGTDAPTTDAEHRYSDLVERLVKVEVPLFGQVTFDDGAMKIREELERKHLELAPCTSINKKLGAHIGKYNGIFARLCLLWHCIETQGTEVGNVVSAATAQRVANFLHGFLLPHALAFYNDIYGLADHNERLREVGGYILAHDVKVLTNRVMHRGSRLMRGLNQKEVEDVCYQLDALGWVDRVPGRRSNSPVEWKVRDLVPTRFPERRKEEEERRRRGREAIAAVFGNQVAPGGDE